MTWATLQQLIRIVAYSLGSYFFGEGVAEGELFQQAIGGLIALVAFIWWTLREMGGKGTGPLAAVALLILAGCATTNAREQWLIACTSYTSAVEQIADNAERGLYTEDQLTEIQRIEAATTPLCLKPTTYEANTLILQALQQLNFYLLAAQE